jgi:hypothetical protein
MIRLLILVLSLALPLFPDWDEDDYDHYQEVPNQISYGGMAIECHEGCGDSDMP